LMRVSAEVEVAGVVRQAQAGGKGSAG